MSKKDLFLITKFSHHDSLIYTLVFFTGNRYGRGDLMASELPEQSSR